jgi:predicted protein tyrosine phosphatase
MPVYVCNLEEMALHARALKPSHLISAISSHEQPATPPGVDPENHLRLAFDDISDACDGYVRPEYAHIERLIEFVEGWSDDRPMLVHCFAGVSRSTAAALITMVCKAPAREMEAAQALRERAPHALPNRRMIEIADELLGCNGRLEAARQSMGPHDGTLFAPLIDLELLR